MSYNHLSPEERFCIVKMRYEKKSIRFIARFLLRSASTVSREIKRNSINKLYWNDTAQHLANQRKAYPRSHTRKTYAPLYDLVIKNLIKGLFWGPRRALYGPAVPYEALKGLERGSGQNLGQGSGLIRLVRAL